MSVLLIPLFLVVVAVPIICAALVYSDAKKRGLSAGLWALFVFFTTIIGVIVYLLARPSDIGLCGNCGAQLRNGFVACPRCGARSARTCPSCNHRMETGWRVCPYCGAEAEGAGEVQSVPPIIAPRPARSVSGLAVAALVITLLGPVGWICFGGLLVRLTFWPLSPFVGLVAIPLGFILSIAALVSIRNNPDKLSGAWMAWMAFVISLLEIAFVAVVIVAGGLAIVLPEIERIF
jgi:RNA polymerase subunit RPABC4/transcription elongation factor Spt4